MTLIKRSSSLIGMDDVKAFIAFSKSESIKISRSAWITAALVAWRIAKPVGSGIGVEVASDASSLAPDFVGTAALLAEFGVGAPGPNSRNTSQTRSWAGNGIDRLNRVRYHRVPYAVASMPRSDYYQVSGGKSMHRGLCDLQVSWLHPYSAKSSQTRSEQS